MKKRTPACDGNGTAPWYKLLNDERVPEPVAYDDQDVCPPLEVSKEAQAMMGVSWCEMGQHWSQNVEDGICDACWQDMLDELS
jgi:hypothetical protein